jgi:hypothetical protein
LSPAPGMQPQSVIFMVMLLSGESHKLCLLDFDALGYSMNGHIGGTDRISVTC